MKIEELTESLNRLSKSLEDLSLSVELYEKHKGEDPSIVFKKLLQKKIEDGILSRLHTAKSYQIKALMNDNSWRYYRYEEIKDKLDLAYVRSIRQEKIKKIENK